MSLISSKVCYHKKNIDDWFKINKYIINLDILLYVTHISSH